MPNSRMEELLKSAIGEEAELSPPHSRVEELLYKLIQNGSISSSDVAEEVAKIVAESPDALDDLKQISNWIASHPQDASEINSKLAELEERTSELNGDLTQVETDIGGIFESTPFIKNLLMYLILLRKIIGYI